MEQQYMNQDTLHLLRECDAGAKMAVSSINDILEKVSDSQLKQILISSRNQHEKLGGEIHTLLSRCHAEEKAPGAMAKGMSWLKTSLKFSMDASDATAADLITDGCHMGIKSLHKYQNQYPAASQASQKICERLISLEEDLCQSLEIYL